jgi:hypothetical protein
VRFCSCEVIFRWPTIDNSSCTESTQHLSNKIDRPLAPREFAIDTIIMVRIYAEPGGRDLALPVGKCNSGVYVRSRPGQCQLVFKLVASCGINILARGVNPKHNSNSAMR